MSDLISRQAILKHIEKIRQSVQMMDDTRRASVTMNGMYLCEKVVRNQPSAQPEIIRCKDCKYAHMTDDDKCKYCDKWSEEYYSVEALYLDGKFFCGFAERRTDG